MVAAFGVYLKLMEKIKPQRRKLVKAANSSSFIVQLASSPIIKAHKMINTAQNHSNLEFRTLVTRWAFRGDRVRNGFTWVPYKWHYTWVTGDIVTSKSIGTWIESKSTVFKGANPPRKSQPF